MESTLEAKNEGNADVNQRASTQLMRARVISINSGKTSSVVDVTKRDGDEEPGKPKGLPEDPWEALTLQGRVIEPPFDMLTLAMLPEHNTVLTPCIEAMEQNIEGFGHRLVGRVKIDDKTDKGLVTAVKKEKVWLDNFFAYASIDESFPALRKKIRKDLETTGNAYLEVIRNAAGKVQGFTHMPSYQIRLSKSEDDPYKVEIPILELQIDGSVKIENVPVWKRHRLFVQSRVLQRRNLSYVSGYRMRWFKEFGDPRVYDYESGELIPEDKLAALPEERRANEMVHFKLYSPRSPYGLPRFIGNLLSIYGDRAAGEINFITISNNQMPNMAMIISNGQLTEGSMERVKEFVESQIQEGDNYSKILLIEAESKYEGDDGGQAKIELTPLLREQHRDALFQNYSKNNQDNVRRCFRLPPILTGDTETYTRACYSEDTETLTENGWKYYWEVQEGERIATLNPETETLEYQEPLGDIKLYDYEGEMYHFGNRNTDVLVTPEHKMWVKPMSGEGFRKTEAQELDFCRFQFRSSPENFNAIPPEKEVVIPELVLRGGPNAGTREEVRIPISLWIEFISAFVADGSTSPEFVRGKKRNMYNVNMGASKFRKIEMFKRLYDEMKRLGFRVFEPSKEASGKIVFTLADKILWKLLRDTCGTCARNKRLPWGFVHYPKELLEISLAILRNTDGTIDERGGRTSWSYSTSSEVLADQVQIMLLHAGHRANLIFTEASGNRLRNFRVLVTPDKRLHKVTQNQISVDWYSGKVYCFEVPGHLFFTRRCGCVTVQGNTAETARRLADEQVFAPEREEFDNWTNLRLFPVMGVTHHKYKTNSPNTTDNTELVKILAGAEKTGGMTPRIARTMLEDVLSIELPEFPPDFDADVPFSMTMAEAVKNTADVTEPGQQVTALKRLEMIEKLTGADQVIGGDEDELMERLLRIQRRLEEKWREVADTPHEHDMQGEE